MSNLNKSNKEVDEPIDYAQLIKTDYSYPDPQDPDFQEKIYRKREFYFNKIQSRKETTDYAQVKEQRDKICGRKFALHEHQALISNYISPNTPYRGALIAHGTGSGKTCLGIAVGEGFKPMIQKYGTKIYVLVSGPLIKESWKRDLLMCTGETYIKQQDATVYVSKNEKIKAEKNAINIALQYYRFMSYRSFYKKVLGEKIQEKVKTKDNRVKVSYRKTKEGEFERDIAIDRIYNLNNTLVIIDEAHNLTGNNFGDALMKIIKNSVNLKILLLSATPMKNLADDIVQLLNFIRPIDDPIIRDRIFTSPAKNHEIEFKEGGIEYLKKMARGYVSYLRGADPLTFAKRVEKGEIPPGLNFTRMVRCKMLPFQKKIYDLTLEFTDDTLDRKSSAVANFAFPGLTQDHKAITGYYGTEGINTIKNQLKSNYEQLNKKIATDIPGLESVDGEDFIYLSENQKSITGSIMKKSNLKYFSIKFYKALKKINRLVWGKKGARTAFVYSNLVKVGIDVFQEILLHNGYLEYDENPNNYKLNNDTVCYYCGKTYLEHKQQKLMQSVNMNREKKDKDVGSDDGSESSTEYKKQNGPVPDHDFYPATYVSVTGKSTEESVDVIPEDKQRILDNVFSNLENREGKFIKLILGSRVMNEGISLKNVAEVHILDVYFNLGKVDQVIGRAIRQCSHYRIINDNYRFPEVKIYKYAVSLDSGLSTEEELYQKAEQKYLLIKKVERVLKEVALDCPLNRHGNIFPEELKQYKDCVKPGEDNPHSKPVCPAICDYDQCEFVCDSKALNKNYFDPKTNNYRNLKKDELDYSTFSHVLARNEIENVKSKIKEMFRINFVYTLQEIVKYVKNSYDGEKKDLFDDFFVFKALDEMIPVTENDFNNFKDTVFDKFNRTGYLIYLDKYYIFQPFDENIDVPMYYRSTYNKKMHYNLTLYNYIKNTPKFANIKDEQSKKKNKTVGQDDETNYAYNFEDVMDYYDSRDEFKYVGIIDKESARRKNKNYDELQDVFKIREQRSKILDKKRGTGIPSIKGAVCATSKDKDYLEDIAKKIGIKLDGSNVRTSICDKIKDRLLFLEKYSTSKKKNKFTYIMIPKNHPIYPFPYNLEDRVNNIVNTIKDKIKFKINMNITTVPKKIGGETVSTYLIEITSMPELNDFAQFFDSLGAKKSGNKLFIKID